MAKKAASKKTTKPEETTVETKPEETTVETKPEETTVETKPEETKPPTAETKPDQTVEVKPVERNRETLLSVKRLLQKHVGLASAHAGTLADKMNADELACAMAGQLHPDKPKQMKELAADVEERIAAERRKAAQAENTPADEDTPE